MSARFVAVDRDTPSMFPPSVQDWLPERHLARYIVEIVDRLNLSRLEASYAGRGSTAYHPAMLAALVFYGLCTRTFSSRKLEAATYDSIAVRYICANTHPDHDTIATFRRRFASELQDVFVQILQVAHELGFLSLGTFALDGTKVHANASKHKALSYAHAQKLERQLRAEVAELQRMSEQADAEDVATELDIPAEIQRRERRLEAITAARVRIEQRVAERAEGPNVSTQAATEPEEDDRCDRNGTTGGVAPPDATPPGASPGAASADASGAGNSAVAAVVPGPKEQVNLTDEQSRIMPQSGGGFEQCYNAQAAVDVESKLVIANFVTQASNDKQQLKPAIELIQRLPETLGRVDTVLADNGYYSEANAEMAEAAGIAPILASGRQQHNPPLAELLAPSPSAEAEAATPADRMKQRLRTPEGRRQYAKRKSTVEPVFGIIKHALGFRQFSVRGLQAVSAEWTLMSIAYNLKRMFALGLA